MQPLLRRTDAAKRRRPCADSAAMLPVRALAPPGGAFVVCTAVPLPPSKDSAEARGRDNAALSLGPVGTAGAMGVAIGISEFGEGGACVSVADRGDAAALMDGVVMDLCPSLDMLAEDVLDDADEGDTCDSRAVAPPSTASTTDTVSSSLTTESSSVTIVREEREERVVDVSDDRNLSFRCGVVIIPHPEKAEKGGEDAFFVEKNALGVFDGVGGWASIGVDAGLYSKELARLTAEHVRKNGPGTVVDALRVASGANRAIGSSTACVVGLNQAQLTGVNLGDSGFIVVRNGDIAFRTTEQQHYFNCPFQIGTDSMDTVDVGKRVDVTVQPGDWIVMGTDGLWDNVFIADVAAIVDAHHQKVFAGRGDTQATRGGAAQESRHTDDTSTAETTVATEFSALSGRVDVDAQSVAQKVADVAFQKANDERSASPFAINARIAGHLFLGGKVDDISVIAAFVYDPHKEADCGVANAQDSNSATAPTHRTDTQ